MAKLLPGQRKLHDELRQRKRRLRKFHASSGVELAPLGVCMATTQLMPHAAFLRNSCTFHQVHDQTTRMRQDLRMILQVGTQLRLMIHTLCNTTVLACSRDRRDRLRSCCAC